MMFHFRDIEFFIIFGHFWRFLAKMANFEGNVGVKSIKYSKFWMKYINSGQNERSNSSRWCSVGEISNFSSFLAIFWQFLAKMANFEGNVRVKGTECSKFWIKCINSGQNEGSNSSWWCRVGEISSFPLFKMINLADTYCVSLLPRALAWFLSYGRKIGAKHPLIS